MSRSRFAIGIAMAALLDTAAAVADTPLGTAFTYQGLLSEGGAPANGTFDLEFTMYDAAVGGNQEGPIIGPVSVEVIDGSFSAE